MGQYDTLQTQIRAARVAFAYDLVRSILQMAADDLGMDIQIGHDNVDTRPGSASTSGYLNCPDLTFVVDVAIGFLDQPYPVTVSVQLYDADLVQLHDAEDCSFAAHEPISVISVAFLGTVRKWLRDRVTLQDPVTGREDYPPMVQGE